jgi:hypothetical protein
MLIIQQPQPYWRDFSRLCKQREEMYESVKPTEVSELALAPLPKLYEMLVLRATIFPPAYSRISTPPNTNFHSTLIITEISQPM